MIAHGGADAGLFRGAVYESGALSAFPWTTADSNASELAFEGVAATLGCSNSSDKLACIRDVPFSTFYDTFNPANNGSQPALSAVIDGDLIADNPVKAMAEGRYVKVPTMLGHNMDEGALFTAVPFADNDTALITLLNGTASQIIANNSFISLSHSIFRQFVAIVSQYSI
jgi:carboxylesterase type B